MPDYTDFADKDEARRVHALDEATRSSSIDADTVDIVARAERFEEYLKNGVEGVVARDEATKEAVPLPEGERPPLPIPKHSDIDPEGNCLACQWLGLERKMIKQGVRSAS